MTDDDRDWRKWAYRRAENWPEAIPWTGPKREFGPYPWGRPSHHNPGDVDRYPSSHPDASSCGEAYIGDVCPFCGVPLRWNETVVLITGEQGAFHEVDQVDDPTPAYHPGCWRDREAEFHGLENTTLGAFQ